MFEIEDEYVVIPIRVADHDIFWSMAGHLGVGVKTWATYSEFEITSENLETALSYYEKREWVWLDDLRTIFYNGDTDRYQFLHYEDRIEENTQDEVVF